MHLIRHLSYKIGHHHVFDRSIDKKGRTTVIAAEVMTSKIELKFALAIHHNPTVAKIGLVTLGSDTKSHVTQN